ncbi:hypothetical protein DSO57_1011977 [Entomophthora muscae]|uniref:Uncharacterized protein n=1 Tax=Entomophthora muscae TaxID=34485 RepID=A0ACC2TH59_9FUNG|nr:hypothetical protein DSO57_1011977 [Entomophthora muscae]
MKSDIIGTTLTQRFEVQTWKAPREPVVLSDLWDEKNVLIKLFRRFGCPLCRLEAAKLSKYKDEFEKLDIKVVGVGFDELGLEEWTEGEYWKFDLFMDPEYSIYKNLELSRYGWVKGILTCLGSQEQRASQLARKEKVGGNMTVGDGFQLGGCLVVEKGGKVTYAFQQEGYADYPLLSEIIESCGGDPSVIDKEDDVISRSCATGSCKL